MRFILSFFVIFNVACADNEAFLSSQNYVLKDEIWDLAPFVKNDARTHFGTYLVRNVPFAPIHILKQLLENSFNMQLLDRGEAHITVITPPEYEALKNKIDIHEIHQMVEHTLQSSSFDPVCIGEGTLQIDGKSESTYFVVVNSSDLFEVRRTIAERFYQRGGSRSAFDPETYYPHITIGYTKRDLHAQDGIVKDQNSCIARVIVETLD